MEVITTHINADFDALASMIAAKKLYPQAKLVFPGSQEKNLRNFFLQSTFYVFEAERIRNIDWQAIRRLILVDTRQKSRIGRFSELANSGRVEIHIFDHHPPSPEDLRGSVESIREVGATVTILAQILKERGMAITHEEATLMAVGLYEDTGSFTFSSTTPEDLEVAGFLLQKGANLNIVSNLITHELSSEQITLLNQLIQSATRYPIQGVEVVIAKASADRYVGDFALLAHKLKDMENLSVLFALAQMENRVYLVARSRLDEVNVGEIASLFGGGGHATAASATIKDQSLHEVETRLLKELEKRIHPARRAKDLMSSPVKTIQADETIAHAGDLLTRYNINALPVMDQGRVAGLITRQIVEKAAFHGFKESPVRDYMTSEFATVSPRTPLSKVQEIIVSLNQRFLPVVEKGNLVGAITRTDLLRWLSARSQGFPTSIIEPDPGATEPRRRWILRLMEELLPAEILQLLRTIGMMAHQRGVSAYAVGGFVRDLILRYRNYDLDVVVEGDAISLAQALAKEKNGKIRTHKKFGTASVTFPSGHRVDLATARLEYYDAPASLPRVEHGPIKLDLYRRDFTINTLAIHLEPASFGELLDFFGGQRDIKERVIRVLHNLSFVEDPTRIFRALRFEQRMGFQIARHTQMLMENAVRMGLLGKLSGRRLFHELVLCLSEEKPLPIIKRMADYNILRFFHPQLTLDRAMQERFERLEKVVSWYSLLFTGEPIERWRVFLLGLVDNLKEKEVSEFLKRFLPTEKFQSEFLSNRRQARQVRHRLTHGSPLNPVDLYYLLESLSTAYLLYIMGVSESPEVKKYISLYFTTLKPTRVLLRGKDLRKMGFVPGPIYTEILKALLAERLKGKIHSLREEIDFVEKHFGLPIEKKGAKALAKHAMVG